MRFYEGAFQWLLREVSHPAMIPQHRLATQHFLHVCWSVTMPCTGKGKVDRTLTLEDPVHHILQAMHTIRSNITSSQHFIAPEREDQNDAIMVQFQISDSHTPFSSGSFRRRQRDSPLSFVSTASPYYRPAVPIAKTVTQRVTAFSPPVKWNHNGSPKQEALGIIYSDGTPGSEIKLEQAYNPLNYSQFTRPPLSTPGGPHMSLFKPGYKLLGTGTPAPQHSLDRSHYCQDP